MIEDEEELCKARSTLPRILENTNSILTVDAETNEPFLIVEDWNDLGKIQKELNKRLNPATYYKWLITYYNEYGNNAFQDMRFGTGAFYKVPEGLLELDSIIEWGFSDEYSTCGNCGKSFNQTPGYHGDIQRYAIVDDEILCGDCIATDYEEKYIESLTNNTKNALKTSIISEERLEELGWKKQQETYESGLREGQNDNPEEISKKYKKENDILFTFASSQFETEFWIWIKPKPRASGREALGGIL